MNLPCVSLQGLLCCAEGRAILDIPSLTLEHGERVAIVGHNGAGKSTLFRVLTGFMRPSHGRVQVLDWALEQPLPASDLRMLRQNVGQVLQGLHLVGRLSALDNALIGALGRVRGWRGWSRCYPAHEADRALSALHDVGMLARSQARADQLSGGERQKVAIARLLMQRPRLILADEPTAALDPAAAAEVCQLLVRAAQGATLVTIVHNPALLPVLAQRVIGLRQGRIAFDLPVGEVGDRQLIELYRPVASDQVAHWQLDVPGSIRPEDEVSQGCPIKNFS